MSTKRQTYFDNRSYTVREGHELLCTISVGGADRLEISINTEFPMEDLTPGAIGLICARLLDELVDAQEARKKADADLGN